MARGAPARARQRIPFVKNVRGFRPRVEALGVCLDPFAGIADNSASSLAEYGILLALIAPAAIRALHAFGMKLDKLYTTIEKDIKKA